MENLERFKDWAEEPTRPLQLKKRRELLKELMATPFWPGLKAGWVMELLGIGSPNTFNADIAAIKEGEQDES